MSRKRSRARSRALQALYQWQLTGQDVADIEAQFLAERDMGNVDAGYFGDLLRGVTSHLHELDDHAAPYLDRGVEQVDPVERAILRLGIYELAFHPEVPYRVAINEAVELGKSFGAEQGHKYVNSILDRVARKLRAAEMRDKPG
jgi:N utilization substance protein B